MNWRWQQGKERENKNESQVSGLSNRVLVGGAICRDEEDTSRASEGIYMVGVDG